MLDKAKLKCSQGYIMYRILRRLALLALAAGAAGAVRAQYTDIPETVAPGRFLIEVDAMLDIVGPAAKAVHKKTLNAGSRPAVGN